MVDEFSSFARMPRPNFETADLAGICMNALVLPRSARPEINFVTLIPKEKIQIRADTRQFSQVLTNLLQNAIDAIDGRDASGVDPLPAGEIVLSVELNADKSAAVLSVQDNGRGLPPSLKDRLTEPYVTTRAKGTGLGLAIVKTILEDHGASLDLRDSANGGAAVTVTIPLHEGPTDNNRGDLANDA